MYVDIFYDVKPIFRIARNLQIFSMPVVRKLFDVALKVDVRLRGARRRSLDDLPDDKPGGRMTSTFPRNSKAKSVLFGYGVSGGGSQEDVDSEKPTPAAKVNIVLRKNPYSFCECHCSHSISTCAPKWKKFDPVPSSYTLERLL